MGQDADQIRRDIEVTRSEMSDTVGAIGYKTDVKARTRDKVTDTKDSIVSRVTGATPDSGEAKRKAKRAAGVAQENPLGLAVGSVAVGFLAGMLLPTTDIEDEKVGALSDQVTDQIKETGQEALEHGKEVAQEMAQSAKETAQDSGPQHAQEVASSAKESARETRDEVRSSSQRP